MRLEPMRRLALPVSGPLRLAIRVARRGDHCGVHKRASRDRYRLGFKATRHGVEQHLIQSTREKFFAKTNEGRAFRFRMVRENPAQATKRSAVI
jgi:hypothetical protein